MNAEDQLRAAGRAVRDQVRDLPELDLTRPGPDYQGTRPGAPHRWRAGWLIPLAAAAAVIVVAATLVTARTLSGPARPGVGQPGPATSGAPANQVPAYYAAITKPTTAAPYDVTIADTATGKALFTIKPSKNTSFAHVTAAGDDRTFVVSVASFPSNSTQPMAALGWDLLRIGPGATGYTLRRLSIPATPPHTVLDAFALSPDGTELAVMVQPGTMAGFLDGPATVRIFSVATGQVLHTWQSVSEQVYNATWSGGMNPNATLRWLANGHGLAFAWDAAERTGPHHVHVTPEVLRLDLAKPGTRLLAGDMLVVTIPAWINGTCPALYPTADGTGAVCGTEGMFTLTGAADCQATLPPLAFRAYSGDSSSFRVLYTVPSAKAPAGKCVDRIASVLWASPSGSTLVGMVSTPLTSGSVGPRPFTSVVGVIAGGRWTPLPINVQLSQLAGLAF